MPRKDYTFEEVLQHQAEDDAWMVVDGRVYDVTKFLPDHPGGTSIILESLGAAEDLGSVMRGKGDALAHAHSAAAFSTLKPLCIGEISTPVGSSRKESFATEKESERATPASGAFEVDMTKPLVFQVGHLGDRYEEWVHQPIVTKDGPRFFESDFMEALSQTSWWVIPVVWLPVVCLLEVHAVQSGLDRSHVPISLLAGYLLWSLIEYSMHRFLFHVKTRSYWMNTLHYLLHGCHHKHPMDKWRLVFPPALTCIFVVIILGTLLLVLPYAVAIAAFGGGLLGYIVYDLTHYYLHHGVPTSTVPRRLKRYHLNHHFKNQTDSYGISSSFWDWVFDTLPQKIVSE